MKNFRILSCLALGLLTAALFSSFCPLSAQTSTLPAQTAVVPDNNPFDPSTPLISLPVPPPAPAGAGGSAVGRNSVSLNAVPAIDDRENTDPTDWQIYAHQTVADINNLIASGWRPIDISVEQFSPTALLSVVYVKNTWSYAKTFWWYVGVNATQVSDALTANNARLISLKAYDTGGGNINFAVVMISNTGADAIGWWWYYDQTVSGVTNLWQANQARLTQVHSYQTNGQTRYAVVMVDNTGVNARGWWWYVNATAPDLVSHTQTNNARLIDLDLDASTGNLNAIMVSCSSGCPLWWWYVGVAENQVLNLALQNGARIIDINTYAGCGGTCYDFLLINNSNAITSRVGEMLRGGTDGTKGLYLKQVGGPVLASLMETTPFEPASTIKATVHLYLMHQLQLGGVQFTDLITKYAPPVGTSCPTNINAGSETFQIADREMMWHSDNTRTRELADHFGTANINSYVNGIGLAQTRINHVIGCGGPPENVTTLSDLALLYENVANQSLVDPVRRSLFFADMAGKAQYTAEGYDWTGLWGTDIPKLIAQEAPADMPASLRTVFQNNMDLAYKAGNYKICPGGNCATYVDHISIFGYAKIPFCDSGGPREFVFGTYIYNSTNDAASSSTFNSTKAELLREQIRAGLAACDHPVYRLYLPAVLRSQ